MLTFTDPSSQGRQDDRGGINLNLELIDEYETNDENRNVVGSCMFAVGGLWN